MKKRKTKTFAKSYVQKGRRALGRSLCLAALACAFAGPSGVARAESAALVEGAEAAESVGKTLRRAPQSFWEADVWEDPDRPFLYYGEDRDDEEVRPKPKAARAPEPRYDDFSRFTTVEALRKEYDRRKEAAIMHPEDEKTMLAFLALSDHIQNRSQRFAEGWERVRLAHPEIDWTATHPLVNAVAGTLKTERDGLNRRLLQTIAKEAGLLWIADAENPVSHAAAPLVRAFAKTHGFSLLVVEKKGRPIGLDPVVFAAPKPDRGIGAKLGATNPATLPALFLVPDPQTPYPRLQEIVKKGGALRFATGAVSVTKMGQDLLFLLVPDLEKFPKALPSERAAQLRAEWAKAADDGPRGSDGPGGLERLGGLDGPKAGEAVPTERVPGLPLSESTARPWGGTLPPDSAAGVAPFDGTEQRSLGRSEGRHDIGLDVRPDAGPEVRLGAGPDVWPDIRPDGFRAFGL